MGRQGALGLEGHYIYEIIIISSERLVLFFLYNLSVVSCVSRWLDYLPNPVKISIRVYTKV